MTRYEETIKRETIDGFNVDVQVVHWHEGASNCMLDNFEPADEHKGSVTVQVPSYLQHRNGHKWFRPTMTTLAELTADYAKQGRENPSREAYDSLQKELEHYLTALDCTLHVVVSKAGIELETGYGISFDWSDVYGESLHDAGLQMLEEYGDDFIQEAIASAKERIEELTAV